MDLLPQYGLEADIAHDVAVIGLGGVLPGARSVDQYFRNLLHQRCFVRDIPSWLWEQDLFLQADKEAPNATYAAIAALVEDPDMDLSSFRIPPAVSRMMSRSQKLALICARTALEDAGLLKDKSFRRDRAAVIMAAISGGEMAQVSGQTLFEDVIFDRLNKLGAKLDVSSAVQDLINAYEEKHPRFFINEDTLVGASPNLVAGRIASVFDLHGMNLTLDAACASSLAALGTAVNSLQIGESDLVIAGGVDTWIDIGAFVVFAKITALAETGCFPFEERADGLVIGEGCGVVILKRLEDALVDGNKIYAVIRGIGNSSDGSGQGITAPSSDGQVLSMQRAYERADIDPSTLDYIECHGTATPVGDPVELESIRRILEWAPGRRQVSLPVGSVKASVGHMRTAAGMAGFFNAVKVIQYRTIPPQTNFETPIQDFDWEGAGLHVPVAAEPLHDGEIRVGVSAYGFGGTNYHVVLSSPAAQPKPPHFDVSRHLLPEVLAIEGDIAFMFPGQGSQYVGMLAEVSETEIGRSFLARADKVVREITGRDLSPVIYPGSNSDVEETRLRATDMAQPAILTISAILLEMVRSQGVTCSMAIGHSVGEYTALYASGVISFEDAIRAVTWRGHLMNQATRSDEASTMASILGPPEDIDALLNAFGSPIVRANLNSYEQIVVAGPVIAVRRLVEEARNKGLLAEWLNVDRAFHSPFVSHAVAPMRGFLAAIDLYQTTIPIPANLSRQIYPYATDSEQSGQPMSATDRQQLITLLASQIDQPVDFVSQVELAYRAGIRRFVEIGPRGVLTGMVQDILQGKYFQTLPLDQSGNALSDTIPSLRQALARPLPIHRRPLRKLRKPELVPVAERILEAGKLPLEDHLRAVVAAVSGYDEAKLGTDVLFESLGIDSLKLVEIVSRLRGNVLPSNYRGFRKLTSIARIIAEVRDAGKQTANDDPAGKASVFRCYLNQERPVSGNDDRVDCLQYEWYVDAPEIDAPAFEDLVLIDQPRCRRLIVRPAVDAATLCNETLPALLEAVVSMADDSGREEEQRRFALVTYGGEGGEANCCFRALTGFMRSVALEITGVKFSYHHLDAPTVDASMLRRCLADASIGRRLDPSGQFREATLEPLEHLPRRSLSRFLGSDDTVLVTGGARGIASCVVRSLLQCVPSRFLLIGQRTEVEPWIVEQGKDRVEYLAADVADPDALRELDLDTRGITLIIHAAGLSPLTPLRQKSPEEVRRVFAVKAMGLENLVDCLDRRQLWGIINFSSITAHFGNLAQADYAAANGFLDGYSVAAVPVLSIGWTAWGGVGMAQRGFWRKVMETSGIDLLPVKEGVRIFERLLAWWLSHRDEPSTTIEVFGDLGVSLATQGEFSAGAASTRLPGDAATEEQSSENVVTLNAGGSGTPVFMICGIYGHAYRLLQLAEDAPKEIPFYALQPPSMDWSSVSCLTMLDMATWYATSIEELHHDGPVALLGTSFGGNMVFEIALLLQRRGREVELLAMVDTMPPEEDPLEVDALAEVLKVQRADAEDTIEIDGINVAETHLSALRNHHPLGRFKGRIQYYLHVGMGWPSSQDRRFLWKEHATQGLAIVPISQTHGQFSLEPARMEIARDVGRMLLERDAYSLDLDDYQSQFASYALLTRNGAEWIRLPDGVELPIRDAPGSGWLEDLTPFKSRLWIGGWALDPQNATAAREVAVFYRDQFVLAAKPQHVRQDVARIKCPGHGTCGFTALVDVYTLCCDQRSVFRLIAIGVEQACQIGTFTVPRGEHSGTQYQHKAA